jgi:O-methyltransferase
MRAAASGDSAELYLELLKRVITREITPERYRPIGAGRGLSRVVRNLVQQALGKGELELVRKVRYDAVARRDGSDHPVDAETMVGLRRLDNIRLCIRAVIEDGIPGDVIETGVWRGGASMYMRAALKAYGDAERLVWVADSFEGVPPPDAAHYPADRGDPLHTIDYLAVSEARVRANFARYGLLDERVRFLAGWFKDTLPDAPIERLAVMRLDGDLYESTMDALIHLYPKLSPGGFVIVDDYGVMASCRAATQDFRRAQGIQQPLREIDGYGVFWRREA